MASCPRCSTALLHRSRTRNPLERIRKRYSDKRLFRCDGCGWRGWLTPAAAERVSGETAATRDVDGWDNAVARDRRPFRQRSGVKGKK